MQTDRSLATAQAALVDALTGATSPLAGFDAAGLRAAMQVLLRKRVHAVRHACPLLEEELGHRFGALFSEYASRTPWAGDDDAVVDALRFIKWNRDRASFPDALRAAAVDLALRHGTWVAFAWLPTKRRVVVGVRLPHMRARVVSLPA